MWISSLELTLEDSHIIENNIGKRVYIQELNILYELDVKVTF